MQKTVSEVLKTRYFLILHFGRKANGGAIAILHSPAYATAADKDYSINFEQIIFSYLILLASNTPDKSDNWFKNL